MAAASQTDLNADISRALAALGASAEEPAHDAVAAPAAAAAALEALTPGSPLLLRVSAPLGAATDTHGPTPAPPLWLRGTCGSPEMSLAPLRLADAAKRGKTAARAGKVVVEVAESRCCDAASCASKRSVASAWIELERAAKDDVPPRVLVAEAADLDAERAKGRVLAVARPLAKALAAAMDPDTGNAVDPSGEAPSPALPAGKLARFVMRSEGDRFVLRDHETQGPANAARSKAIFGITLLVLAAPLWIEAARSFSRGDRNLTVGLAAVALLITLAGYAFVSIARYASRYRAASEPLFWVGHDRFVIAPWVSREGAVDKLPEGRIGAAIALEEVRSVSAQPRDGHFAVEVDSDHGQMDVLASNDEATATFWASAIRRTLADFAHPKARASARKRARERAA